MQKTLKNYFPIFLLPALIAFLIAFLIPFFMGVYLSFCKFTTVTDAKFVGIRNYVRAFSNQDFLHALLFTALFAIVAIVTLNLLSFGLAMLLTKKIPGTNVFRTVFFMPNLIGGIVLGYIWPLIFNGILAKYGVTLLADAIDGTSRWQLLRHVTIPMVMPSITICLFLTVSNSFKLFDQNLALTNGAPGKSTSRLTGMLYYLFVFAMIVPFQMVMFTMVKVANMLYLDNPIGLILIYLGFGAGLSVFMFCGFVKSIPVEIEEAALGGGMRG